MALSVVLDDLPGPTEALWAHILDGVRAGQDVDILADLVVSTENYTTCARVVREVLGHRPEPDSSGLRYRHRHPDTGTVIDLLCPDHRAPAAALRTLAIDGGYQAMQRRTTIEVSLRPGDKPTPVPLPDLLGASVLKAAAAVVDSRDPQRHVGDLALLDSLMDARRRVVDAGVMHSGAVARPYDLRHSAVSTWLAAGVDPTQIAAWAGHSVAVMLRVYANRELYPGRRRAAIVRRRGRGQRPVRAARAARRWRRCGRPARR